MQISTVLLVVAWAALAHGSGYISETPVIPGHHGGHYPAYTNSYSVADAATGDKKTVHETRDGQVTKGSYSFVQPDGVTRTVNYVSTPTGGFQAQVINSGPSIHGTGRVTVGAPLAHAPIVPSPPIVHQAPFVRSTPIVHSTPIIEHRPHIVVTHSHSPSYVRGHSFDADAGWGWERYGHGYGPNSYSSSSGSRDYPGSYYAVGSPGSYVSPYSDRVIVS